ncbi:uncharacterized protein LOC130139561 isoform X2 [Syzygium oleosum]|uniref:uncharacterized protein LOC130139561 isoform X2 n=1 Tax=Syzygium oleosum TaxID=219896 RepID=UPI0024BB10D7|nr:uncharacterized protein LOC130139561 isoform X2 [Syzygium oleosum]
MNSRPCLKARVSAVRADGATIFFAKPPTSRPRWSLQIPATAPCCDSLHHDPSTFNFHEPDGGGDHPSIGKPLSSLSLCFPSFWFQCSYRLRSLIASVITPRGRGLLFRKTFAFRSFQMSQSTLARIPPDFDPTWEVTQKEEMFEHFRSVLTHRTRWIGYEFSLVKVFLRWESIIAYTP